MHICATAGKQRSEAALKMKIGVRIIYHCLQVGLPVYTVLSTAVSCPLLCSVHCCLFTAVCPLLSVHCCLTTAVCPLLSVQASTFLCMLCLYRHTSLLVLPPMLLHPISTLVAFPTDVVGTYDPIIFSLLQRCCGELQSTDHCSRLNTAAD